MVVRDVERWKGNPTPFLLWMIELKQLLFLTMPDHWQSVGGSPKGDVFFLPHMVGCFVRFSALGTILSVVGGMSYIGLLLVGATSGLMLCRRGVGEGYQYVHLWMACGSYAFAVLLGSFPTMVATWALLMGRLLTLDGVLLLLEKAENLPVAGYRGTGPLMTADAPLNRCAWDIVFGHGRAAQLLYSDRQDGKMSAAMINRFASEGRVRVYTPEGYLWPDGALLGGPTMFIENGHATVKTRPLMPRQSLANRLFAYVGPPVGTLMPPKCEPMKADNSVRREMIEMVDTLRSFVDANHNHPLQSVRGQSMVAESGLIACLEELDVLNHLAMKPSLQTLTRTEVIREYLTDTTWHVFDLFTSMWIGKSSKPTDGSQDLAWNGSEFVTVTWRWGKPDLIVDESGVKKAGNRYLLVIEGMPYRRGLAFGKAALRLIADDYFVPVRLVEGVPSCGKTTYICDTTRDGDLITLPSRAGALEYAERDKVVRTLDSLVVEGWSGGPIGTLWVDEGLLTHPGTIHMAMKIVKPVECRVFGDRNQIPFICRVPGYKLMHPECEWDGAVEYHEFAYRNPKVVCDLLRPLYPSGYVWANEIIGSLATRRITSVESVAPGYSVYLTFTQSEKEVVKRFGPGGSVMTIHEAQGLRFERVALVRLKINDIDIYKSRPHVIVALSRAWRDFAYFTVNTQDMVSSWIKGGVGTPSVLDVPAIFEGKPYHCSGGGNTIVRDSVVKLVNNPPAAGYDVWQDKLAEVGPLPNVEPLAFCLRLPLSKWSWIEALPFKPSVLNLQVILDNLFHRRNPLIAYGDRLFWPIKWPYGVMVDPKKASKTPKLEGRVSLKPNLITPQPDRAIDHPLDVREAFDKRVVHAPKQKLDYGPERVAKLVDGFIRNIDMGKLGHLNLTMPLTAVSMKINWWNSRDEVKRCAVLECTPSTLNGSKYYCVVRSDHKPKLDDSHIDGIPAGQLVTAHHPFWTSLFAPIFQVMTVKLLAVLKPNIVLNTRLSWDDISGLVDNLLSGKHFQNLELDIGKFDKSQDEVMLEAQCEIFKLFGMCDWMIDLWRVFHQMCVLVAPAWGVTFHVGYQRRSGDSLTWLGNTIVLLMTMAYLYPIEKAYLVLLGGDDNSAAFPLDVILKDQSKVAAEQLNFEVKAQCLSHSMYFSSRFIVNTRHGWYLVADPVKLIVRLGRTDLQGEEHLKAIHESWRDLHRAYLDPEVRRLMNEAVTDRYNMILNRGITTFLPLINAVANIVNDFTYLKSFFNGTPAEWALKLDPREKFGEGLYVETPWMEIIG